MLARLLIVFANGFVVAYAADAGFSVVEEFFRTVTEGSFALFPLRNGLAGIVVLASLLVAPAMVLTPRLPVSVLAPLALSALWMASGAAPVNMVLGYPGFGYAIAGLQATLALLALLRIRALSGGRSWLIGHEVPERPAFSLSYSVTAVLAVLVCGSALTLAYLPFWALGALQTMTDGFVRFDHVGVSLADRRYVRDGQEVRLVGMMHIGEGDSYEALVGSFAGGSTIVLEEGVTDREGLLRKPLSYERVARALGLEGQAAIETYLEEMDPPPDEEWPDVRHADVDLSEFHPDTITWLEWTTEIWSGADPAAAVLELFRRYSEDPARWSVIGKDVIERRNVHLVDEIRGALVEYDRVIVPWGALHQPFIQYAVLEMGFAPVEASYHPLASWGTMAAAVWPAITRSEDAPR